MSKIVVVLQYCKFNFLEMVYYLYFGLISIYRVLLYNVHTEYILKTQRVCSYVSTLHLFNCPRMPLCTVYIWY